MFDFHPQLKQRFAALRTGAEFFSLRYVRESGQYLSVRKAAKRCLSWGWKSNIREPPWYGVAVYRCREGGETFAWR